MKNTMNFGKYKATICYDPEIGTFRGGLQGLNGASCLMWWKNGPWKAPWWSQAKSPLNSGMPS